MNKKIEMHNYIENPIITEKKLRKTLKTRRTEKNLNITEKSVPNL